MTTHQEENSCCDLCIDSRLRTQDEMELYCRNEACVCHKKKPLHQDVLDRFDKIYVGSSRHRIKDFITQILTERDQVMKEEIERLRKPMNEYSIKESAVLARHHYNEALDDLLAKLKGK